MRYLDREETQWPLCMHFMIGTEVSLHSNASGKLFISQLPDE